MTLLLHRPSSRESHSPPLLSDWSTPYARMADISGSLPRFAQCKRHVSSHYTPLTAQSNYHRHHHVLEDGGRSAPILARSPNTISVHICCLCTVNQMCSSYWLGIASVLKNIQASAPLSLHFYTSSCLHNFSYRA